MFVFGRKGLFYGNTRVVKIEKKKGEHFAVLEDGRKIRVPPFVSKKIEELLRRLKDGNEGVS